MKKIIILIGFVLLANLIFPHLADQKQAQEKPLEAYTFDNLKTTEFPQNEITVGRQISETSGSVSRMFYCFVPEKPQGDKLLRMSGVINLPKNPGTYPVIVMFRGYAPEESYYSGVGTQPVAQELAEHGYITLAPDFLGYGESDKASEDGFEARFQTYSTALTLLTSINNLNNGLEASSLETIKADTAKVGIWGHSNGGHISLAALAVSGKSYPTVLWAPVSKPFPYSILVYYDEHANEGKALRNALSQFEKDYDTQLYSPPNYYHWIKAPININQGSNDQEIPIQWSDELVAILRSSHLDVQYHTHRGADHNLLPLDHWSNAVSNSLVFYDGLLKHPSVG
jgi:dipeptidyl aminopeptidase/acylaminoacyl peptidase